MNIFNEFSFSNFDNFLNDCKHFFINILLSLTCVVLIKVTWFYVFVVGVVHMKPVNNDCRVIDVDGVGIGGKMSGVNEIM